MSDGTDWKAFFDPKLVFIHPVRTLAIVCAVIGIIKSPFDFNNRYLAFGFFLLSLSFATKASRDIYRPSNIGYTGEKTQWVFSAATLFQSLALWPLTLALALLCLHQLGLTQRLDGCVSAWRAAHPLL